MWSAVSLMMNKAVTMWRQLNAEHSPLNLSVYWVKLKQGITKAFWAFNWNNVPRINKIDRFCYVMSNSMSHNVAIGHVHEYPKLQSFGISRHTQSIVAFVRFWMSISGNSSENFILGMLLTCPIIVTIINYTAASLDHYSSIWRYKEHYDE